MKTRWILSLLLASATLTSVETPALAGDAKAGAPPAESSGPTPPSRGNFSRASRELPAAPHAATESDDSNIEAKLRKQMELAKLYQFKRGPRFSMIGEVRVENNNTFSINGEFFKVGSEAAINGSVGNGVYAEVSGPFKVDEMKVADSVVILDPAAAAAPQPLNRRSYSGSAGSGEVGPNSKAGRER